MRNIILLLGILLMSCGDDEDKGSGKKCITGINSQGERVFIRCATREQFNAGSNVSAGGTANWNSYTFHQFEACENCD